jgi:PLD-like domain
VARAPRRVVFLARVRVDPLSPAGGSAEPAGRVGRAGRRRGRQRRRRFLACTLYARAGSLVDPVYVHAKVGIVDDRWLTVGSANLNEHSLFNDTEMNVVTHDPGLARATRLRLWAGISRPRRASWRRRRLNSWTGAGGRSPGSSGSGGGPAGRSPIGWSSCRGFRVTRNAFWARSTACWSTADAGTRRLCGASTGCGLIRRRPRRMRHAKGFRRPDVVISMTERSSSPSGTRSGRGRR